jgi:hypothetical protein
VRRISAAGVGLAGVLYLVLVVAGQVGAQTEGPLVRAYIIGSAVASGGTSLADDGDFTAGTTTFTPVGGFYQSSVTACTDGDACAAGITTGRALKVAISNADGSAVTVATDATHDSAASATGPQVMAGAESTVPSAVSDGDAVRLWSDLFGRLVVKSTDPCSDNSLKTSYVVDIVTATTVEFLNGAGAGNYIYVCSINLVSAGANNVAIFADDTDNCASFTAGDGLNTGGSTAGEGWNFAANGGIALGDGASWVMKGSAGTNRYGCIVTSAAVQLSGTIVYALAP